MEQENNKKGIEKIMNGEQYNPFKMWGWVSLIMKSIYEVKLERKNENAKSKSGN